MKKLNKECVEEVRNAMKALSYREGGHVTLQAVSETRATVRYENEYFGIYDFEKHTFVD